MTPPDLPGGLPAERENVQAEQPPVPLWSENQLFAVHDPASGLSLWLHLGTVPDDWSMWHEMVYAVLSDGDGLLSASTFHRTAPERRPAGHGCAVRAALPQVARHLRRPRAAHAPAGDAAGNGAARPHAPVGRRSGDRGHGRAAVGRGALRADVPGARGTVRVRDREIAFDGYGWRDHSQGPRGADGGTPWGGHVTAGSVFEDGRGWGATRFWGADGRVNLEAAWVCDASGRLHDAQVLEAPSLRQLVLAGEELPFALRWSGGVLEAGITTTGALWLSMRLRLALGRDDVGRGSMFVPAWGTTAWEGLTGGSYVERSNPLNALPEVDRD